MATMVKMVKRFELIGLILIVVVAGWLRFCRLGSVPPSLDWDEVSQAYNAESLLQTGRDEFGHSWPLSIQSFNDYKPPVYTYLLIPVLKVFGKTEFAIRFPSALAGTLTVLVVYFLVKELFNSGNRKQETRNNDFLSIIHHSSSIGLTTSFLLAISPWHIQFSRIAFEANAGLFFFIAGMWLLIRVFHKNSPWSLFFSVISMSAAMMSYHSLRVVAPLTIIATLVIYRRELLTLLRSDLAAARSDLFKQLIPIVLSAILTILTILTISYTVFFQKVGQSRFEKTSFLTIDNLLTVNRDRLEKYGQNPLDKIINIKYFVYAKQYIKGYLDHFDLRFLFLDGDRIDRHRTPGVGLLYWWELPFLAMGLISLIRPIGLMNLSARSTLIAWFLIAPAASALTGGTPSAVRSLIFLPTFQILTAIGFMKVIFAIAGLFGRDRFFPSEKIAVTSEPRTRALATHGRRPWEQVSVVLGLASIYLIFVSFEISHYFHQYYIHSPLEYAPAWQYGYKQMVKNVMAQKNNYEKIVVTTSYDQPYIYFLWYGDYDPKSWVNDGEFNKRFDKFEFKKIEWDQFPDQQRILVISSPDETKGKPVKWQINYPDGKTVFNATEL